MQIRRMAGTFGKLHNDELNLASGFNIIYAPNESGKSTWSQFLCTMLYGLNTRDRSPMADKNRYAPWDGSQMQGQLELSTSSGDYTITRTTLRSNVSMGEFHCTHSGTAGDAAGIDSHNCGEYFLGVSREIYQRSAFIGQNALTVDYSSSLEQRISSLITTGEEDISYADAYGRLKKQLNSRRTNSKNGKLPLLEQEIDSLQQQLDTIEALQTQIQATTRQLNDTNKQLEDLKAQDLIWQQHTQWQQLQHRREVECAADDAALRAAQLSQRFHDIPDEAALQRMENDLTALQQGSARTQEAQLRCSSEKALRDEAQTLWQQHPLYPTTEAQVQSQLDHLMLPPAAPRPYLYIAAAVAAAVLLSLGVLRHTAPLFFSGASVGIAVLLFALIGFFRRKSTRRTHALQWQQLTEQAEVYLPLLHRAAEADSAYHSAAVHAEELQHRQQELFLLLGAALRPYFPDAADANTMRDALQELRQRRDALDEANHQVDEARFRYELLCAQQGNLPNLTAPPPDPAIRKELVGQLLPQVAQRAQELRSRLDTLNGQLQASGDSDSIRMQLSLRRQELSRMQQEYEAISLAMDVLEQSNTQLQNRFSPALGAKAAEIFRQLTASQYGKVYLNRDFSLSAEVPGDLAMHGVQYFSHGTADQLYLSVRLALCDMVLPQETCPPLILDDALVSFDDRRLHAALDYLWQESRHRQILLFTCHKREAAYLSGREGVTCLAL